MPFTFNPKVLQFILPKMSDREYHTYLSDENKKAQTPMEKLAVQLTGSRYYLETSLKSHNLLEKSADIDNALNLLVQALEQLKTEPEIWPLIRGIDLKGKEAIDKMILLSDLRSLPAGKKEKYKDILSRLLNVSPANQISGLKQSLALLIASLGLE